MSGEKSFIDTFFDHADKIADGLDKMVTPISTQDSDIPDAEIVGETPSARAIIFGGVPARHDSRGLIWHAFDRTDGPPLCAQRIRPDEVDGYRRPNAVSHEAITFCFACLSKMAAFRKVEAKQLEGGKP